MKKTIVWSLLLFGLITTNVQANGICDLYYTKIPGSIEFSNSTEDECGVRCQIVRDGFNELPCACSFDDDFFQKNCPVAHAKAK